MGYRLREASSEAFVNALREHGAVYFIKDEASDTVKIGHSLEPTRRLSVLQVGNPNPLTLLAVIPGPADAEALVHREFEEGHIRGEWFHDRGVISSWQAEIAGHGKARCVIEQAPQEDAA